MILHILRPRRRLHILHAQFDHLGPDGKVLWRSAHAWRKLLEHLRDTTWIRGLGIQEPRWLQRLCWEDNILPDEGEQAILSAYFDTDLSGYGSPPANLYLRLDNRGTLAEGDQLTSLSGEPSTNGYAAQSISTTTGFTISQPGTYYQAASGTKTFGATGGSWGPVSKMNLATVATGTAGKLICALALQATRTLSDGDTLNATITLGLSE